MKNKRALLCVWGLLFLMVSVSFAAVSRQVINFQGYLTDKNGQPVFGTRPMSFAYFSSDSTGTKLGSEESRQVVVYNGNYSTKLDVDDVTMAAFGANQQVWLEVNVNGVTMNPRVQLVAVPFAGNVRGIEISGNNQIMAATINASGVVTHNGIIRGSGSISLSGPINVANGVFSSFVQITARPDSMPSGWNRGIKFSNTDHAAISIGTTPLFIGLHDTDDTFYFYNGSTEYAKINSQGVHSAVWNDLAEVRELAKGVKKIPGKVYVMTKEGLKLSSKRAEIGTAGVCSDTYGFSLGGKNIAAERKAHIAISGWVLAYVDKDYPIGTALTSGPNGVLTAMTKKEKMEYPERIVGILDTKPENYNNIKIDGRYWVKVK